MKTNQFTAERCCHRCNRPMSKITELYRDGAAIHKVFRGFKDDPEGTIFSSWECSPCNRDYEYMPGDDSEQLPSYYYHEPQHSRITKKYQ